ncbi:MAG: ATP-dependent DNA helicase RecG [Vulcanimicrobiaceae bacterium]
MTLVRDLAGVGAKTAALFEELGVVSAADLLEHFPFRYDDLREPTPAAELGVAAAGEENAVGTIVALRERRARGLEIVEATLRDESGTFQAKWIGRNRYVVGRFSRGLRLFVRGRTERTMAGATMNVTAHAILPEGEAYHGALVPIYPAGKELPSRKIAQVVKKNLPALLSSLPDDPLPVRLAQELHFPALEQAYRNVHAPQTPQEADAARRRFIFAEFLVLASGAQLTRSRREQEAGARPLIASDGMLENFQGQLAFGLTSAQARVIGEIWSDMAREIPMNRLLQGDVGSGKTLVAAAAILLAARNDAQAALMAPTEILAMQHAAKLAPLLLPFGITVEVVLGAQSAGSRSSAVDRLASGAASLAIGTHALLTQGVEFARLGLVVIDEQHRFGVEQRATLRAKGGTPHTLHMTATPIPRTLAQSIYADLDISTIDELPPGRTPIQTYALRRSRLDRVYALMRKQVEAGHQVYVVAPAIEESESELTSALVEAERFQREIFADLRVEVLHGRLPAREKEAVMKRFVRGEVDVLVATTVVEVGVDVANATTMVILDAHRYGLAQLHQLRGRVGRGAVASYCILVTPDDAADAQRLAILTQSSDGFAIAEEDLRLRGPGQFSGTVQAGKDTLRHADFARDVLLYRQARAAAQRILTEDPGLTTPEYRGLRRALEAAPSLRALLLSS